MVPAFINNIFKSGSTTYSTSSIFFPSHIRDHVSIVYAFVRTFDNFVDKTPQDVKQFNAFKKEYYKSRAGMISSNQIIRLFHETELKFQFNPEWTDAFIQSMEMDMTQKKYQTIKALEEYMYGSANVIGLFMAKLMNLPSQSYHLAERLGKSMQFLNFIRDIEEDLSVGRTYFPQDELKKFKLKSLELDEVSKKKDSFIAFMNHQLDRYFAWQRIAEKGFRYIPKRYLIPIKTASDMYKWTGKVIQKNPFIVYKKKVKPSKMRILATGIQNLISIFLDDI